MKWMIASDLHGSAFYGERLLEAFSNERADRLLLLGDLLYHGPRNDLPREYAPKSVIAQLSSIREKLFCVRGNCDAQVDQMVLPFPILAEYCLLEAAERLLFATHGDRFGPDALPPVAEGSVVLYGHTHVPGHQTGGGLLFCNPGSLALPKENSPNSYMTLESGVFYWKELASGDCFDKLDFKEF